jgi:phospholipid/cholesterol/gamma-HCH transport system ATP-binding protein
MRSQSKQSTQEKGSKDVKIKIRGLSKSFKDKVVLDNLDLDIFENESLVVLGGSGSGKSVLIKCIIGLLKPDAGSIKLNGADTVNLSAPEQAELMGRVGFLFQSGALFDSLRVWENIAFFAIYNKNATEAQARDIAAENLVKVGLNNSILDLYPSQLSGGMQKRVAFARAIAHNPEILFFDEPTTGLDPIMTNVISDFIIHARKALKATTITITHDIKSTHKIATRVAMLYQGKIVWTGSEKKLDNPGNEILDQFIKGNTKGPITAV